MPLSFALSRKQTRRTKRSMQKNQMTDRGHVRRNRRWHRPRRGQGQQERWRYAM